MLLINGVTGNLGTSVLELATASGLKVIGLGRNKDKLLGLKKKYPEEVFLPISDVTSESEASKTLDDLSLNIKSEISMYLHAVGVLNRTLSPLETSIANFSESINVNLVGAFIWNKLVMANMIQGSVHGSILNVASQAARTGGYGGATSYAAAKGGLVTLSKSFSRYGADFNIRVNSISPGFLNNAMMLDGLTLDQKNRFIEKTALKRLGSDLEIAEVCIFLLGNRSSYITGENIEVSAGQVLG
jgi:3-oxoacyl-[acyl-carrier protein] reductase